MKFNVNIVKNSPSLATDNTCAFGLRKLQLQIKELELSYFNDHYLVVVSGLSLMEFSPDMVPILTRHTAHRGNGFRQLGQA